MAAPIGPGDWVECITTDPFPQFGLAHARAGSIYRVTGVWDTGRTCTMLGCAETWGLHIDADPPSSDGCHCACIFRPIYRPKADLIESLKAPPERVGEFA